MRADVGSFAPWPMLSVGAAMGAASCYLCDLLRCKGLRCKGLLPVRPGRVARCCVSALIRLTAATGHPRLPSRSVRLGRQANASRDMRRPRGTSNHGALLANSHRIAACGLQLADCRKSPGRKPCEAVARCSLADR